MPPTSFAIEPLATPPPDGDVRDLAELLIDAVDSGAAVSFVAPLEPERAAAWWRGCAGGLAPDAVILVARDARGIIGTVQLHPAWAPNQPHRGDVAKLIVHRRARGLGVGKRLMEAVEQAARDARCKLLTLDTRRGSVAEGMYRGLGWIEAGIIPRYAVDPDGRGLHDTVVFYKELGEHRLSR